MARTVVTTLSKRVVWGDGSVGLKVCLRSTDKGLVHIKPINLADASLPAEKVDELIESLKEARGLLVGDMVKAVSSSVKMFRKSPNKKNWYVGVGDVGKVLSRSDDKFLVEWCCDLYTDELWYSFVSKNDVVRVTSTNA